MKLLKKINWTALQSAASNLQITSDFSDVSDITEELRSNESFLKYVNHLLFEVHVQEGFLVCPVSSRRFPVKDGIPNMLLHEDEI